MTSHPSRRGRLSGSEAVHNEEKIIVKRYEYEEPYHLHLDFFISNGNLTSSIDIYSSPEELKKIGHGLASFPSKVGDEYCYVYGSEDPADRFYRYFHIRAYTIDSPGHCAIQFKTQLNQAEPNEGQSLFSLVADPAAINRLGKLFIEFSKLKHKEFHWSPAADEMFKERQ